MSQPTTPSKEVHSPSQLQGSQQQEIRIQDRFLPIANVARIMKRALPKNAKVAKEAKETVQECVSEFISFITSEASERCSAEKRKTINGEDILFSLGALGFDNYMECLRVYLQKYRKSLTGMKTKKRRDDEDGKDEEAFGM